MSGALQSFEESLDLRVTMGLDLIHGTDKAIDSLSFRNPSILRDYYLFSIGRKSLVPADAIVQPDLIDLFLTQGSYQKQKSSFSALSRSVDRLAQEKSIAFSGLSYLNWNLLNDAVQFEYEGIPSKLDGSLIHQSRTLYGCPTTKYPMSLKAIRSAVSKFLSKAIAYDGTQCLVTCLVENCLNSADIDSVSGLRAAINKLKRSFWFVIGGEIFNALQMMLSPREKISLSAYERLDCIFKNFFCIRIYRRILLLRACSGDQTAKEALKHSIELATQNGEFPRDVRDRMSASEWELSTVHRELKYDGCTLLHYSIDAILSLKSLCKNKRMREFVLTLAEVHERDQEILYFVNWTMAHRSFRRGNKAGSEYELLAASYFLSYCLFENHPSAHMSRSQGSFIAKLHRCINDTTRFVETSTKIDDFARRVSKLPDGSTSMLSSDVLRRDVLRLVPYFGSGEQSEDTKNNADLERQVSDVRFQLAESLHSKCIIDKQTLSAHTFEELEYLKLLKFYEHDKKGRVRIPWKEFKSDLLARLIWEREDWYVRFVFEDSTDVEQSLIEVTAEELAYELSSEILFFAPNSLDWCLSNHVRHGHIVAKYLSEVYSAIDDYAVRHISDFDPTFGYDKFASNEDLEFIFPGNYDSVRDFIDNVTSKIDEYKEYWLSLDLGGLTHSKLTNTIQQKLIDFSASPDRSHKKVARLAEDITTECKVLVDEYLQSSRTRLESGLEAELHQAVSDLVGSTTTGKVVGLEYLDNNLRAKLSAATTMVAAWLHQNQSSLVAKDFKITDITNYFFRTVFAAYGKVTPPYVRSSLIDASGKVRAAPTIDGMHFEFFFQVLFNVMQNAFVHSGFGRSSYFEMYVEFRTNELHVSVRSDLTDEKANEVRRNYRAIVENAQSVEADGLASEGGSGIAKIKRIAKSAFDVPTKVNIPPMSNTRNRFTIEYSFPVETVNLVANEAKWSRS